MNTSLSLTAAVIGLLTSQVGLAASGDAHMPTSDLALNLSPALQAPPAAGFKGQARTAGQRLDAEAEFPASVMSAAELAEFKRTFKPLVPSYARAAVGDVGPESVLDSDRRFRIYPQESGYPYRAIGQLTFSQGGSNYICTGWLIGANTVVTAGHCVHSGGSTGVWSTNMVFYPGRNGASAPYGSCTAKSRHSVTGWTRDGNPDYDYGAIKLNCTIGNTTGWFGRWWQSTTQVNTPIAVIGYPGDKPASTQWGGAGKVAVSETRRTRYKIDTAGGQSGGVVVQADGNGPSGCQGDCGIAIHTYAADSNGNNSGTRITEAVNTNLQTWINLP